MDWDSHRYLECMFAIPMIGAVIHTINVRLSPEQILYTMNHAEDRFVLVNSEFVGLYQAIAGHLTTVEKTLLLTDGPEKTADLPNLVGEYEQLLAAASPQYDFQDFDENSVATTVYTTRYHRQPQGRVFHPSASWCCTPWAWRRSSGEHRQRAPAGHQRRVHADHPDVPRACLGTALCGDHARAQQVYPGRYDPEFLVELWRKEKVTFSHCVPTILQMAAQRQGAQNTDFGGWKIVIGGSALNRSLYEAAKARGIQLTAAYGMSETGPLVSCAHLERRADGRQRG